MRDNKPDLNGAPSRWLEMLGGELDHVTRVELQWATGRGDAEYLTFYETTIAKRAVKSIGKPDRWFIETDDGGSEGLPEVIRRFWDLSHNQRDELESSRGVKAIRSRLAIFDKDGVELDGKATWVRAGEAPTMADDESTKGLDKTDRASLALVREMQRERRDREATVIRLVEKIEGIAGNIGDILGGVVGQSNATLAMQQAMMDQQREEIDASRDDKIMDYRGRRFFDTLEPIAMAYAKKEGLDVEVPTGSAASDGAASSAGGSAGELTTLAREVCDEITEEHWIKFREAVGLEAAEDLQTAIESSLMFDATDDALRESFRVAWPAVDQHKSKILPIVGMALGLKLQRLGELARKDAK